MSARLRVVCEDLKRPQRVVRKKPRSSTMSTGEYDDDDDDGELREEPLLIPPLNFAMVNSGIYRSGYPNKKVLFITQINNIT